MRIAVFVLALVGGILGIIGTLIGLGLIGVVGGIADSTDDSATADEAVGLGARVLLGLAAAIVTILGGALVMGYRAPRRWGVILIVANIIGLISAGGFYILGAILGFVAGVLALLVRRPAATAMAVPPGSWPSQPPGWPSQPAGPPPPGWGTPPPGLPPAGPPPAGWPPPPAGPNQGQWPPQGDQR